MRVWFQRSFTALKSHLGSYVIVDRYPIKDRTLKGLNWRTGGSFRPRRKARSRNLRG